MSFRDWCIQNHAYLLLHFYQEGNNPCAPEEIGFSAGKRVRFRCHVCGLSWQRTLNNATRHPVVQTWLARISNRTSLGRGCPQCAKDFKMSYPARALFYYLRQACPSCTCEEPFRKYKMDIFLPERELVLEHDGYYYHSSLAARKRAERKDRALREAGYQVLRICDSRELAGPIVIQKAEILFKRRKFCTGLTSETGILTK